MPVSQSPETRSPSRRALLAGALGGLGAWAASAISRPRVAQAHDVDDVLLGGGNTATALTWIHNTSNTTTVFEAASSAGGAAVAGISNSSYGLWGVSTSSYGVYAQSETGIGNRGSSGSHVGVYGTNAATDHPATSGWSHANGTGVQGYSNNGTGTLLAPKAKTGVYGYAAQDSNSKGVYGESPAGYAGYFVGKVYSTKWYELNEISNPPAPTTNRARLFVRDNGAGKTQLCVRFEFGAVQVIATQP